MSSSIGLKLLTWIFAMALFAAFFNVLPLGCVNSPSDPIGGIDIYDDDYAEIIKDTQALRGRFNNDNSATDQSADVAKAVITDKTGTEI